MATATINSGVCGFNTTVNAETGSGYECKVVIESDCPHVTKLAETLDTVNVMDELFKQEKSLVQASAKALPHRTCPVIIGILKAVEVSAGLALPKNVEIKIAK